MRKRIRRWLGPTLVPILVFAFFAGPISSSTGQTGPGNLVLKRALDIELGRVKPAKYEMPVSSGPVYTILQASGELQRRVEASGAAPAGPSEPHTEGCSLTRGLTNVRVNQDCSFRRQAEEVIAINPKNGKNLVAGQNDSRVGFNHCGYDWSFDGGLHWGDQIPPFYQFVMANGFTPDACSDPAAAFDSRGNVYVTGILFQVFNAGSAILVSKSNADNGGAFYHTPLEGPFQEYSPLPYGVVASDADPAIFHDKELMAADSFIGSPKRDNVYITWTRFNADTGEGVGSNSPIYFSQSEDGGVTWSPGVEISGRNPAHCTDFSGSSDPAACDQDQGSHPFVGPDGTIYVAFGNGNTPKLGINQVLFVKCPAAADCSNPASWTQPVKVNDLIGTHPINNDPVPDPDTGCPPFRQCLPPNGYRVPEFTSISVSVDAASNVYVSWADFRNGDPNCMGTTDTAEPPCNNDVFYAFSGNGGATFSDEVNVTPQSRFGPDAQWQPWSQVAPRGGNLWIAYYDRSYRDCEQTGCNDITLAKVNNPKRDPTITYQRLTTGSMPNLIPANNPLQAGFLGDYMWVAVDRGGRPHVVWADTRGRQDTVEEDIYFWKGD
jgi:hypothetical protein